MLALAEAAASGPTPYLYLIVLFGSGGALAAILGFVKLRGDRDSQAVSQAQGAMETMDTLNDALKDSLARANARGDFYKHRCDDLEKELGRVHERWGPFPIDDEA